MTDAPVEVRAAGGLVVRSGRHGPEVLVVHRPRYDDWSLPKGKVDPGESLVDAAVREVREETGIEARPGPEVGRVRYRDRRGRTKEVVYWRMTPLGPTDLAREPDDEVDEVRWVPVADAARLLTYEHDRRLVAAVDGA